MTESFTGLGAEDRGGCQTEENRESCVTRNYLRDLRQTCGCVPLRLGIKDQVCLPIICTNLQTDLQDLVCTGESLTCAEEVRPTTEGCQVPCTGMFADVQRTEVSQQYSASFQELLESYDKYKSFNSTKVDIQYHFPGMEYPPDYTETQSCAQIVLLITLHPDL